MVIQLVLRHFMADHQPCLADGQQPMATSLLLHSHRRLTVRQPKAGVAGNFLLSGTAMPTKIDALHITFWGHSDINEEKIKQIKVETITRKRCQLEV
ncbi:hypothetical protein PGT21_035296 [Puccinia graminis f. sp. tritici]|nr:hypothetical protein PGT21_035296 [Puccinia graminis f. sp. tritici]KAA1106949.1 hypothetical protein PGTUg99_014721 [Puccinia graminis f. sp. tritici]